MFPGEFGERSGERRRAREVAAHHLEHSRVHLAVSDRAGVRKFGGSGLRRLHRPNGAVDFAERPQRQRPICHRADACVLPEPIRQIRVARGIENGERLFAMAARFGKLPGEPAGDAVDAMGDARLRRMRPPLDVMQESRGVLAHRRQFAAHVAAGPKAVERRKMLGRILV